MWCYVRTMLLCKYCSSTMEVFKYYASTEELSKVLHLYWGTMLELWYYVSTGVLCLNCGTMLVPGYYLCLSVNTGSSFFWRCV